MKNYINKITQSKWTGIALAAVGILMMAFGIYRGEMEVVFTKAVNICMECIGIDEDEWSVPDVCGGCIFSEKCVKEEM